MIVVEHKGGGPGDKEGVGRPHLIDTDLDTGAVLADMVESASGGVESIVE